MTSKKDKIKKRVILSLFVVSFLFLSISLVSADSFGIGSKSQLTQSKDRFGIGNIPDLIPDTLSTYNLHLLGTCGNVDDGIVGYCPLRHTLQWGDGEDTKFPSVIDNDNSLINDSRVNNTLNEESVYTADFRKNTMQKGRVYELYVSGKYSTASSNDQFTMFAYVGGNQIMNISSEKADESESPFMMRTTFTVKKEGTNGWVDTYTETVFSNTVKHEFHHNKTVDTTVSENVNVTIKWNNQKTDNIVDTNQAYLRENA